jgi:hypothetical protein
MTEQTELRKRIRRDVFLLSLLALAFYVACYAIHIARVVS